MQNATQKETRCKVSLHFSDWCFSNDYANFHSFLRKPPTRSTKQEDVQISLSSMNDLNSTSVPIEKEVRKSSRLASKTRLNYEEASQESQQSSTK